MSCLLSLCSTFLATVGQGRTTQRGAARRGRPRETETGEMSRGSGASVVKKDILLELVSRDIKEVNSLFVFSVTTRIRTDYAPSC